MANALNPETLKVALRSIDEFAARELPDSLLIELDERDEFPEALVPRMSSGEELGIQLLFVPFEYGGMGGGAFDVCRICERMAAIDLGLATSELATFLGSDPIRIGGTEEQKAHYMGQIAKEGVLFAYGATEPEAGSDLGALKTVAEPMSDNGSVSGYRISGAKQWISNGGVADLYTILAMTPGGPSWFVVEAGAEGFTHGHHEDKHGIRLSNTAALFLNNVYVDADRLIGGVEGQGLVQAQQVFGYTRLMVAAFGLGAGWSAVDRTIPYSKKRAQAGSPLSEKQGDTHKLIVPHAVALEAARSAIEETAERIDAGEGELQIEGAVAELLATEAGDAAAEAAIQAHGGYGYTNDYMVEKIKRDVWITRIYEGTSEIMEITIARGRWQEHLKSGGSQHILMRLGELIALTEGSAAFARRAQRSGAKQLHEKASKRLKPVALAAASRVNARNVALRVGTESVRWVTGADGGSLGDLEQQLGLQAIYRAKGGLLADMAEVRTAVYGRMRA